MFLFALLVMSVGAEDVWVLLPEPKFMGHKVTRPIAESEVTVLAVAKWTSAGAEFPSEAAWNAAPVTEAELQVSTVKQAALWLKDAKPELVRDDKKVLRYAVLRSDDAPLAATVLTRDFWVRFEPLFGAKMRVVIPNRRTVFVFPDITLDLREHGPLVMAAWRSGAPKVSLEVFEVTEKGMRAVGAFREP